MHPPQPGIGELRTKRQETAGQYKPPEGRADEDPQGQQRCGEVISAEVVHPPTGVNGYKRKNGPGIRQGQQKHGDVSPDEALFLDRDRLSGGAGHKDSKPQVAEKQSADKMEPYLLAEQKTQDQRQPQHRNPGREGIRRGDSQTGDEAIHGAPGQRSIDAQQTDRADRHGNDKPDEQPFKEKNDVHSGVPLV